MDNIQRKTPNYTFALIVVFAVLFLIGFITTMNNSMIDFCKKAFNLKDAQGQLVNTAFYGAYALSIPFGLLMNKIGYKKTLLLGLAVVGIGFIINYLGISSMLGMSTSVIYSVFLGSMFIVALGIVMLQLVANPYVMVLGSPEKGAFRMTLANALNSAATTVAPVFITYVIIAGKVPTPDAVPGPYLGLGIFTLILCAVLFFLKLPNINEGEQAEELTGEKKEYKDSVFQYPHVWLGMLGIFFYMGIELGVPSMLPAYFKSNPELAQYGSPTDFLPYYWGSMMVGRFAGAIILNKSCLWGFVCSIFIRPFWNSIRLCDACCRSVPFCNVAFGIQPRSSGTWSSYKGSFRHYQPWCCWWSHSSAADGLYR